MAPQMESTSVTCQILSKPLVFGYHQGVRLCIPADSFPTTNVTGFAPLIAALRCDFALRRKVERDERGTILSLGCLAGLRLQMRSGLLKRGKALAFKGIGILSFR